MKRSKWYSDKDFLNVQKIDAHIHMNTRHSYFNEVARENNFTLLSINTEVPEYPLLPDQQEIILEQQSHFDQSVFHLTSFDTSGISEEGWSEKALEYVKESIDKGACGVKVWKNIGMDLKREDGSFVMICDREFDDIFGYLEARSIPVLGHIGEPRNCWLPIEEMTVDNDRNYYSQHPEFHMYHHPEYPGYNDLINSRDQLLENHPDLLFIGAHLGSLEWSVDEVAIRLDKYSNLYVDLTDRICHLQYQSFSERNKIKDFFYAYQDRIIYGTDLEFFDGHTRADVFRESQNVWMRDWKYFVTDEEMVVPALDSPVEGLKLEASVVDKIYRENAKKCYRI